MRINVIPPELLTDNHLIAEYRESKMATYYYVRSAASSKGIDPARIPSEYTLGKGHAYFWFDKMLFLKKRFDSICAEMRNRGFQCNHDKLNFDGIPESAFGDYEVTMKDIVLNLHRILIRIAKQPDWYRYRGQKVENWESFYNHHLKSQKNEI